MPPADSTSGKALMRSISCLKKVVWRPASGYFDLGRITSATKTFSASKPGSTAFNFQRVLIKRPAPHNKTSARVTSLITSALRNACRGADALLVSAALRVV